MADIKAIEAIRRRDDCPQGIPEVWGRADPELELVYERRKKLLAIDRMLTNMQDLRTPGRDNVVYTWRPSK